MTTPGFREMYGNALADQVDALASSPKLEEEARQKAAEIAERKRREEAQTLKEICDGADNKVYGKAGQELAKRFVGEDGKRDYYMQLGLRDALNKAGLLRIRRIK